eukprot:jgi/Chlat1/112/Chrsp1S03215
MRAARGSRHGVREGGVRGALVWAAAAGTLCLFGMLLVAMAGELHTTETFGGRDYDSIVRESLRGYLSRRRTLSDAISMNKKRQQQNPTTTHTQLGYILPKPQLIRLNALRINDPTLTPEDDSAASSVAVDVEGYNTTRSDGLVGSSVGLPILPKPTLVRFGSVGKPRDGQVENVEHVDGGLAWESTVKAQSGQKDSVKSAEGGTHGMKSRSKGVVADESSSSKASGGVVEEKLPKEHTQQQQQQQQQQQHKQDSSGRGLNEKMQELLERPLDVILNHLLFEMRGSISCGGHLIMDFRDYDQLLAVEPKLLEVIPKTDEIGPVSASSAKNFGTCAVVGNSGALLQAEHGVDIDACDTVIRFNAAPTKGYESRVGTKTTIRIQNVDHLGYRETSKDKILLFTARNEKDVRKYVAHRRRYLTRTQYVFNPEWWCYVWEWVNQRGLKPSTGMAGVVLALRMCTDVHLYGFSHNATQFHYYNTLPTKVTQHDVYQFHPLIEEAAIFHELAALNRLTLHV